MAFCWWADDGPLLVVYRSSLPHYLEKKCCQSWTPSGKNFWIRAWVSHYINRIWVHLYTHLVNGTELASRWKLPCSLSLWHFHVKNDILIVKNNTLSDLSTVTEKPTLLHSTLVVFVMNTASDILDLPNIRDLIMQYPAHPSASPAWAIN